MLLLHADTYAWVVPIPVVLVDLVAAHFGERFIFSVSMDIMEHCDPSALKDSARNIFTNAAVTAALVLTMAVACMQADPITHVYDTVDDDEIISYLQQFYAATCMASSFHGMKCVFMCVVDLAYVEPLAEKDAIKYFIANPGAIGRGFFAVTMSVLWLSLALCAWTFGTYGLSCGACSLILLFGMIRLMAWQVRDRSAFDPSGETSQAAEWQWTMKNEDEWPEWVRTRFPGEHAPKMVRLIRKATYVPVLDEQR